MAMTKAWLGKELTVFTWACRIQVGLVFGWILAGQILRQTVAEAPWDKWWLPNAIEAISLVLFYAIPLELFLAFPVLVVWGIFLFVLRMWRK